MSKPNEKQIDKFRKAARAHEADESEETFNAALKKVAQSKPSGKAHDELADAIESDDTSPEAMERMAKLIGNK